MSLSITSVLAAVASELVITGELSCGWLEILLSIASKEFGRKGCFLFVLLPCFPLLKYFILLHSNELDSTFIHTHIHDNLHHSSSS